MWFLTRLKAGNLYKPAVLAVGLILFLSLTACSGLIIVRPVETPTVEPTATPRLDVTPEDDRPRLRVVNASLRVPIADIYFDDRLYFRNVYYSYISTYVPVNDGEHRLRIRPAGIVDSPPIAEREWNFQEDRDYTAMIISTPGGIDQPWIFEDNNKGALFPGQARMRMVHAALDMPALELCIGEQCEILAYKQVSDYLIVDEGPSRLTMRPVGTGPAHLIVLPIVVQAGEVYTVFVLDPEQGEIRPRLIPHMDTK